MKREFGSKLIEQVLPRLDLTHVVDTSGAYIPGHGTPTVILFGRHRVPVGDVIRTVMGIKGEPSAPDNPSTGAVWTAIVQQIDQSGSESDFVSVIDLQRSTLAKHPWSIAGGGATDCLQIIESSDRKLTDVVDGAGLVGITGEDDFFLFGAEAPIKRLGIQSFRKVCLGQNIRDYVSHGIAAIWPYDEDLTPYAEDSLESPLRQLQWRYRVDLEGRKRFGRPLNELNVKWYEWREVYRSKINATRLIGYAEVGTHNHFALLDRGTLTNQTAPVIALSGPSAETEAPQLVALLNSSSVCFWLKQVCQSKGGGGINEGHRGDLWEFFYQFSSTKVGALPIPNRSESKFGDGLTKLAAEVLACSNHKQFSGTLDRARLDQLRERYERLHGEMIAFAEEIDWETYDAYGLLSRSVTCGLDPAQVPLVRRGERAFEILLARRISSGQTISTWFERHGIQAITSIPSHWPEDYRLVVQQRIDLIERDRNIGLIERPEYKRRWNTPAWEDQERAALRDWLLDWLEDPRLWSASDDRLPQLTTVNRLADVARADIGFMQIAELYAGHSGFEVTQVVAELVAGESVPFLPVLRYSDNGLRKRTQWEDTWALQRRGDAGEKIGKIPAPPKYQNKDFLKADYWRLRGGLDVPKERWVSYPGCERGADTSLPIAWAGLNHLQQATALAAYYLEMKDTEGWEPVRLQGLLAGLLELVPWLEQWHNDIDPAYGERMGTYYRGFINEEARTMGFTSDDLRAWKPVLHGAMRGRKKAVQPS